MRFLKGNYGYLRVMENFVRVNRLRGTDTSLTLVNLNLVQGFFYTSPDVIKVVFDKETSWNIEAKSAGVIKEMLDKK